MITISEKIYNGLWTAVAIVDGPKGTFVGPFILDLPEDATDEELVAAIQQLLETAG